MRVIHQRPGWPHHDHETPCLGKRIIKRLKNKGFVTAEKSEENEAEKGNFEKAKCLAKHVLPDRIRMASFRRTHPWCYAG